LVNSIVITMKQAIRIGFFLALVHFGFNAKGVNIDLSGSDLLTNSRSYIIDEVIVESDSKIDNDFILAITGLKVNTIINKESTLIAEAIRNLHNQGFEADIYIKLSEHDRVCAIISIREASKLDSYECEGISKSECEDILKDLNLTKGVSATDIFIKTVKNRILDFLEKEGRVNYQLDISTIKLKDNFVKLFIKINKGQNVVIRSLKIVGNKKLNTELVNSAFTNTTTLNSPTPLYKFVKKELLLGFFRKNSLLRKGLKKVDPVNAVLPIIKNSLLPPSFSYEGYESDKNTLLQLYNSRGYIDASISDSLVKVNDELYDVHIHIKEGEKFFIRNVNWSGNVHYNIEKLNSYLNFQSGDVYNKIKVQHNIALILRDLYYNAGYLFTDISLVEVSVDGNFIDIELRVNEGERLKINKVNIKGNIYTEENVIRRQLLSFPGDYFSMKNINSSIENLGRTDIFDPNASSVIPIPNFDNNTVDVDYNIKEKLNFKFNIGTNLASDFTFNFGLNNFSLKKLFNLKKWSPLPLGSGQSLSLFLTLNKNLNKDISVVFIDPWIGGSHPYSIKLDYSGFNSKDELNDLKLNGHKFNFTLGREQLRWPDRFSSAYFGFSALFCNYDNLELITGLHGFTGKINDLAAKFSFTRNSTDSGFYPLTGNKLNMVFKSTIPYSLFTTASKDYRDLLFQKSSIWLEYNKLVISDYQFINVFKDFVINIGFKLGLLGNLGGSSISPFNRFILGEKSVGFYDYTELRGYTQETIPNERYNAYKGGVMYEKLSLELRYQVSSLFYLLGFVEFGDCWPDYKSVKLFNLKRSYGLGGRVNMPILGYIGFNFSFSLDNKDINLKNKLQFNISNDFE
jgi:outer membrane protein insertion porin family